MTLVDLVKDLIDTGKERLKTPISAAFLWSFLIYNWRPIAVLLFSNAPVEDRIIVINHEYFGLWSFLVPIAMALVYTVGVPMLMVKIDKVLAKTKKARIEKIYSDKADIMDGKIRIAEKEFVLKDIESGNQKIEELLTQIEGLKESNSQMAIAHNNTITQLNKELEQANETNSSVIKGNVPTGNVIRRKRVSPIIKTNPINSFTALSDKERILNYKLTEDEIKFINNNKYQNMDAFNGIGVPQDVLDNFVNAEVVRKKSNGMDYSITDFGRKYISNY